jgi:DNA-binding IclR family transcriptional regulator
MEGRQAQHHDAASGVGVLDKAVVVMASIEREGPAALAELAARTKLPRPTAHRLAVALEVHGLLWRDGDGRFCLGPRLAALGAAAERQVDLARLAAPALAQLRDATGESVQLYVRDGAGRRCIAALESPSELRTIVAIGALLPLDRGSAGRVLTGTPGRDGWVDSVGEREAGVASVSAAVRGAAGHVVAAISLSGPIPRLGKAPGRRYGPLVVAAAAAVEAALAS